MITPIVSVQIEMQPDDVKHGEARNCRRCPVARALQRYLLPQYQPLVGVETISFIDTAIGVNHYTGFWVRTPDAAVEFINQFDERTPSEFVRQHHPDRYLIPPVSFEINLPAVYLRPIPKMTDTEVEAQNAFISSVVADIEQISEDDEL